MMVQLPIVLAQNFFMFRDIFFEQIRGTVMRSNVFLIYDNLSMEMYEKTFVYTDLLIQ